MIDPELRYVDAADVYRDDALVATLGRTEGGIAFEYLDGVEPEAAVATTLPVSAGRRVTQGGAVPQFFAGLLPEGRRLQTVVRALKTSRDDDLSILLAIGHDTIGNIRVVPKGAPLDSATVPVVPRDPTMLFADFLNDAVGDQDVAGIPGVQDKISSSMLNLPAIHDGSPAIIKFGSPTYPLLVENEDHFLSVAAACGLAVPHHEIIRDASGATALAVTRFDRSVRKRRIARFPQEDAVQLAGLWPADKARMSAAEVARAVTGIASSTPQATRELLRQFAFGYLIGNGDLHGKNVSVRSPEPGIWLVTPAYDILSTIPYGDRHMTLKLEGRDDNISGEAFLNFAERYGLRRAVAARDLESLADRLEPLVDGYDAIGFPERRTLDLQSVTRKRIDDVRRGLVANP